MSGIIHVGAHRGEEIPVYIAAGCRPIICFEPLFGPPQPNEHVVWVNVALGDREEVVDLHVPYHIDSARLDTQSASGLRLIPERAKDIGWTPTRSVDLCVPMMKFATWAAANTELASQCNHLVIDVQGMELQVLRGFEGWVQNLELIKVECSSPPVYDGGADAAEVVRYLREFGFYVESPKTIPPIFHGDIRFRRAT